MHTDRIVKVGEISLYIIRDNIIFTTTDISSTIKTHNFKWTSYISTTLNTFIYLLETAHPRTTIPLTRTHHCIQHITNIPHSVGVVCLFNYPRRYSRFSGSRKLSSRILLTGLFHKFSCCSHRRCKCTLALVH